MNRAEKDKLKRYGKLVWDFSNSKTTDDILTSFFENLQSAFNFSSDFKEKALKRYPTKQMLIGSLSDKEYALFDLLLKRNEIFHDINNYEPSQNIEIIKYDPELLILTISIIAKYENDSDGNYSPITDTIHINEDEIEKKFNEIKHLIYEYTDDLLEDIKELIKLCHQIEDMKPDVTKPYEEMELNADVYFKLIPGTHRLVANTQKELNIFLLQFIKSELTYKSKYFDNLLSIYNKIPKSKYAIDNYKLIEINPLDEDYFLNNSSFSPSFYTDANLFDTTISYCLIEYLKHPEYQGKERISVCQNPKCHCIFSKSKLNGKQKYCPACSRKNKMTTEEWNAYQKKYRASLSRKRREAKKKREAKIQHLMTNAGKTRKEAEQILDNDM